MRTVSEQKKKKEFGNLVKELRKSCKLSQQKLGDYLKVTSKAVGNIEGGSSVPKAEKVVDLYTLFNSVELIYKYMEIQHNYSELIFLSSQIQKTDYQLSRKIMKNILKASISEENINTAVVVVFHLIMWALVINKKINRRKIEFVIKAFDNLDQDKFVDLLNSLYKISFKHKKQFDAFITIVEKIIERLKIDGKKLYILMYQYATAQYYKGECQKAYKLSTKALEIMGNIRCNLSANVFSRHGLICLQIGEYSEALESFNNCFNFANDEMKVYCYLNIGRTYFMLEDYKKAYQYFDQLFSVTDTKDKLRINVYNHLVIIDVLQGNLLDAEKHLHQCEKMLEQAKEEKWDMYEAEHLLWKRNKALVLMEKDFDLGLKELLLVCEELKRSHLRDEYNLTKNLIVEKLSASFKI